MNKQNPDLTPEQREAELARREAELAELERLLPKDAAAAVYHHFRNKGEN